MSRVLILGIAAAGLAFAACGQERGDKRVGDRCVSNDECRLGYCVGDPDEREGVCTRSCASTEECPRGWACSAVTQDNVLVCSKGAPTPFGIGARE